MRTHRIVLHCLYFLDTFSSYLSAALWKGPWTSIISTYDWRVYIFLVIPQHHALVSVFRKDFFFFQRRRQFRFFRSLASLPTHVRKHHVKACCGSNISKRQSTFSFSALNIPLMHPLTPTRRKSIVIQIASRNITGQNVRTWNRKTGIVVGHGQFLQAIQLPAPLGRQLSSLFSSKWRYIWLTDVNVNKGVVIVQLLCAFARMKWSSACQSDTWIW